MVSTGVEEFNTDQNDWHSYLCVYMVLVAKDDYRKGKFRWPLLGRWVTYSYNTPRRNRRVRKEKKRDITYYYYIVLHYLILRIKDVSLKYSCESDMEGVGF